MHDSALQTQKRVECAHFADLHIDFLFTLLNGLFLVADWLLGEGEWPLLYNFRGGLAQVGTYNVICGMGC